MIFYDVRCMIRGLTRRNMHRIDHGITLRLGRGSAQARLIQTLGTMARRLRQACWDLLAQFGYLPRGFRGIICSSLTVGFSRF